MRNAGLASLIFSVITVSSACAQEPGTRVRAERLHIHVPRGLPRLPVPADNPLTAAKVELGKQLYFDRRLSKDNTVSCATCHAPELGWSDGNTYSLGIDGQQGSRHAPTVLNAVYNKRQFWDGRAATLEEQALGPIINPVEMGMTSLSDLENKLNQIAGYRRQFQQVFGSNVTADSVAKAIASFERTLISGDAPYDRFQAGDRAALSEPAQRGLALFLNKAHCAACHSGPNFTDGAFHNIGVGLDADDPDVGRQAVSQLLGDRGSFKTPGLRDVARRAPYMHDGSQPTLEDVIDYYNKGGTPNAQLDEEIYPLKLTPREKRDLLTFLVEGLASNVYPKVTPPALPK